MSRENYNSDELEPQIQAALQSLPELMAPPDLSANVWKSILQQRQKPWFARSWEHWPLGARMLLFAVLLLTSAGVAAALWFIPGASFSSLGRIIEATAPSALGATTFFSALGHAGAAVIQSLSWPLIVGTLLVLSMAYAGFIYVGSLLLKLGGIARTS